MVMSCACFGPRHFPYSNYLCRASDIASLGTIYNVFSFDAVYCGGLRFEPITYSTLRGGGGIGDPFEIDEKISMKLTKLQTHVSGF